MYFKQIEIIGFKSFADRSVVRLEPGITAIVGPNGCGKSNVMDAMRWALGEQSPKALRGTHMQDVIFNGSEHRPATGMAEVSLLFDNADSRLPLDFAEVEVTRRVYRSGESEYLINKAPCRLRDVQELFMDTGIGTNAYSLIGQGKIDLVLSSKPEDRRYVFEEAAGIIKYKSRKQAALRRLDSAAQNILRLSDIVAEVQHQMRRLKRQVNAAIRYRELTSALRELEIRAAWTKFTRLTAEVAELRTEFAKAQDDYAKASARSGKLEARREQLGLTRIETERLVASRREALHLLDAEMEKIERTIALLRQQIDFSRKQQQQALREQEEFAQRAAAVELQLTETDAQGTAFEQDVAALRQALEEKQGQHEAAAHLVSRLDAHLETVRARALEAIDIRAKSQTELDTLDVSISNIEAQLVGIEENQQVLRERRDVLEAQLKESQAAEADLEAALAALGKEQERLLESQTEKTQSMRSLNERWQQLREKNGRDESRLHSLRELRDSYEGFASGVRAVMQAKQGRRPEAEGVLGPAGDLLSTDKFYEQAIEAALGGNINNLVVKTAAAAKSAIAFLKENRAGRVTFLPLDTIRPSRNDDMSAIRNQVGYIGPAIDYVTYDPAIRVAVEYLLHNTVVVQTIDDAIRIARTASVYPRLVTLDGEVVSSAGAVTGGRTRHESRGLLGRSAEIAELEEQVVKSKAEIAAIGQEGEALTVALQQVGQQIKQTQDETSARRKTLNELGVAIARCSTEFENLGQSGGRMDQQRADLTGRREKLVAQRQQAAERVSSIETDDETRQQEIARAQEEAVQARAGLSARAEELADVRVQLAELSRSVAEMARNKERERREREEAQREGARRAELAAQHQANEQKLEADIAQNVEGTKALSESREEARKNAVEAQGELQKVLDEYDSLTKKLREVFDTSRAAQDLVHQKEMALRHAEDQIAFFQDRMLTEYRVDLASLEEAQVGADEYDEETRESLVVDYRTKLERLGQVNMMAIEEYEELEKRNTFLVTQQEDLVTARETLLSVVTRIDKTIRDMFLETFDAVSENFRNYFRRLFNGGQARIYLLNEDDPLESGIEIEARPPGKKPQTIHLLSGGEQAMTAIALLFSIFRAKPSPFCVLDEVDAPLDDANINRFLVMVEEFTDQSQFIVITHSKQTMAKSDVLYGVTMQERGVSQLVSVKFSEDAGSETAA